MELRTLSEKRGIYSIFKGDEYIIYSSYYGVVAHSTEIKRTEDYQEVNIKIDICTWYGYWDLKSIISRGINKLEKQYKEDKKVKIEYNTIEGTDNSLSNIYYLDIKLERR